MTTDNLWNRKALSLSLVTWLGGDSSPEILQKVTSCLIEWTKRLHCNWLEDTLILQTRVLLLLFFFFFFLLLLLGVNASSGSTRVEIPRRMLSAASVRSCLAESRESSTIFTWTLSSAICCAAESCCWSRSLSCWVSSLTRFSCETLQRNNNNRHHHHHHHHHHATIWCYLAPRQFWVGDHLS